MVSKQLPHYVRRLEGDHAQNRLHGQSDSGGEYVTAISILAASLGLNCQAIEFVYIPMEYPLPPKEPVDISKLWLIWKMLGLKILLNRARTLSGE